MGKVMKRFKTIDSMRGLSIWLMIWAHCAGWWLKASDIWIVPYAWFVLDWLGAGCFIFIAGVSAVFSIRSKEEKVKGIDNYNWRYERNTYLLRALLIMLIALIYNLVVAITIGDLTWIWSWFFLFTLA